MMTDFREKFDRYRRMFGYPRKVLQGLFYVAFREIGASADAVTRDMLVAMADAWEQDNGPPTWEKVEGYAAGLDDSRQLLTPMPHPALQQVAEGLTAIGRDYGVAGTIFTSAVLDPRHGRVIASLVFESKSATGEWVTDDLDVVMDEAKAVALQFGETGTGTHSVTIDNRMDRVVASLVFTLKGWNDPPAAACECGRTACCHEAGPAAAELHGPSVNGHPKAAG
jgi:hypothetical protein